MEDNRSNKMNKEAQLKKEIEELRKIEPHLTKEELAELLMGVKKFRLDWNISIVRAEAELLGITEERKRILEIVKKLIIFHNVLPFSDEFINVNNSRVPCWRQNIIQPEDLIKAIQNGDTK
jgi:hypothetical protein